MDVDTPPAPAPSAVSKDKKPRFEVKKVGVVWRGCAGAFLQLRGDNGGVNGGVSSGGEEAKKGGWLAIDTTALLAMPVIAAVYVVVTAPLSLLAARVVSTKEGGPTGHHHTLCHLCRVRADNSGTPSPSGHGVRLSMQAEPSNARHRR